MEQADRDLLDNLLTTDSRLKNLFSEHQKLEKEVAKFERYAAFSTAAALRQKQLKKEKLRGMDTIMTILNHYKGDDA